MKTDVVKSYWNNVSLGYIAKRNDPNSINELIEFPALTSQLKDIKNKKVLDVGCAFGAYSVWAKKHGAREVVGIDLSDKMIEYAISYAKSQNVEGIKFLNKDAADLSDIADNYFDVIICSMTIGFFDILPKYFSEFYRVLKEGGIFIFSEIHPFKSSGDFLKKDDREVVMIDDYLNSRKSDLESPWKDEQGKPVKVTVWHRSIDEISSCLFDAGFVIRRILEPKPTKRMLDILPKRFERDNRLPVFLIVESIKL